ncbi:MAG: hypothetical protein WEB03_13410 [Nitriliruptor sp.]|uniref:hypothetical protein n=1 Tax=Nitriliruptor sp. TaxID=2448056 RepID=UPI0034A09B20
MPTRLPDEATDAADTPPAPDERPPALIDDPAVVAAINAHDEAQVALVEAKHQLTRARESVRIALFNAGKRYRDRDLPLPRDDVHRLYWDHRELRLTDLSNAFGISTAELARLAGPTESYGRCDDCQLVVPMLLDTRAPKPSYGPPVRCAPCQDRHEANAERERQRQHELDLARVAAGDLDHDPGVVRLHGRSPYDGPGW